MTDQPFLSRVYDVKYRFEREHGIKPTQLFLGPKELKDMEESTRGQWIKINRRDPKPEDTGENITVVEMTIIGLASDGMRAGISST